MRSESRRAALPCRRDRRAGRLVLPTSLLALHRHGRTSVLVVGGTGRDRRAVAGAFHRASMFGDGPLVAWDATRDRTAIEPALSEYLGLGADEPLAARGPRPGTLFVDRLTHLTRRAQRLLLELAQRVHEGDPRTGLGRIITGCAAAPETAVARGALLGPLLDLLDKVRIEVRDHVRRSAA